MSSPVPRRASRLRATLAVAALLTATTAAHAKDAPVQAQPSDPTPSQQGPQLQPGQPPMPGFDHLPDVDPDAEPGEDAAVVDEKPDEFEDPEGALDRAFADLKTDDEQAQAEAVAVIERIWSRSGSASMDLLFQRAKDALAREDLDAAILHLTDLVTLAPDFAEGWHLRARAYFQQEEYGAAIADIGHVLALEDRHFLALAGLGTLFEAIGEEKKALDAFRRALEFFPGLPPAKEAVERLETEVEGRQA